LNQRLDLTTGNITAELLKMATPIMLTMFVQMAYNLTDMLWLGHLGSGAVAAVGTAGFFVWFGNAMMFSTKVGVEVGVAQSVGRRENDSAVGFAINGIKLAAVLALAYSAITIFFAPLLMSFFRLGSSLNGINPTQSAISYLQIVSSGMIFTFVNPTYSGVFNGIGDSKSPFRYNAIGLVLNVVLDPLLIFGIGPLPRLGVNGAAIATVLSQLVVWIVFYRRLSGKNAPLRLYGWMKQFEWAYIAKILKIGFPVAAQSMLFAVFGMVIARIISHWGPVPIAVQRVGSQIEALSWMTASGFATALGAFVGQNYGARKFDRIRAGYVKAILIMGGTGVVVSLLLILFPGQLFRIFIQEPKTIEEGIIYLRILGYSQLFMCLEITTGGAFNGIGKTVPPSIVGIVFNALRIPAALLLSAPAILGLSGVWWSISASSMFKGVVLVVWFYFYYRAFEKREKQNPSSPGSKNLEPSLVGGVGVSD